MVLEDQAKAKMFKSQVKSLFSCSYKPTPIVKYHRKRKSWYKNWKATTTTCSHMLRP